MYSSGYFMMMYVAIYFYGVPTLPQPASRPQLLLFLVISYILTTPRQGQTLVTFNQKRVYRQINTANEPSTWAVQLNKDYYRLYILVMCVQA